MVAWGVGLTLSSKQVVQDLPINLEVGDPHLICALATLADLIEDVE